MHRFPAVIIAIIVGQLLAMCSRELSMRPEIQTADSLMRPDLERATFLLDSLEASCSLTSRRDRASLALLRLEERYYHDVIPDATDDSLVNVAENYFRTFSGGSKPLMLTLFLKGSNAVMRGDYADGVLTLLEAEELAGALKEYFWLAQTRQYIARAYEEIWEMHSALDYYIRMKEAFEINGDSIYIKQGWRIVANSYLNANRSEDARPYINRLLNETRDTFLLASGYDLLAFMHARLNYPDSIIMALNRLAEIDSTLLAPNSLFIYVRALASLGRIAETDELLKKPGWRQFTPNDIPYTYWVEKKDYKQAFEVTYHNFVEIDSVLLLSSNKSMNRMISGYWSKKREVDSYKIAILIITISLLTVTFVILGVYAILKIRRTRRNYEDAKRDTESLKNGLDSRKKELDALREKMAELRGRNVMVEQLRSQVDALRSDGKAKDEKISAIESRLRELDAVDAGRRERMLSLVGMRYKELDRLYDALRSTGNNNKANKELSDDLRRLLDDLKGNGNVGLLADYLDYYTEGLYEKFITDFPGLSQDDSAIVVYTALGIPGAMIASLIGVSDNTLRVRRSRLRKRVQDSTSEYKNFYLRLLAYKKDL